MSKSKKPDDGRTGKQDGPPAVGGSGGVSAPAGPIATAPAAQPIFTFTDAASAVIQGEYQRTMRLLEYDPMTARSHDAWERLREEQRRQILHLGRLGAEAIRAGTLAHAAPETGELVRQVMDCIRNLHGWVSQWWSENGDYYAMQGRQRSRSRNVTIAPIIADEAIALIRPASEALSPLANRLHDIAIAIPAPQPAGKQKARRGRRPNPTIDPNKDKRLCADWKAVKGTGMSRQAFARERGITVQNLIDAQHREKYRRTRDAE